MRPTTRLITLFAITVLPLDGWSAPANSARERWELMNQTGIRLSLTARRDGNRRVLRIPLEDDAVVTERGVEWLYPVNQEILLIR